MVTKSLLGTPGPAEPTIEVSKRSHLDRYGETSGQAESTIEVSKREV